MLQNPFSTKTIPPTAPFCGRRKEFELLCASARSGTDTVLFSPRRYGKTSLVLRVLEALSREDLATPYVDFFGVSSTEEVARKVVGGVLAALHKKESLLGKGRRFLKAFSRFRPGVKADADGFSLSFSPIPLLGLEALEAAMEDLDRFMEEQPDLRLAVAFDEFQEITRLPDHKRIEAVLRSHVQRHHRAGYVFVGSRRSVLLSMFDDRARPFYQAARKMELGPLQEEEAAAYVSDLFTSAGGSCPVQTARMLVRAVRGYPGYVQKLAGEVFLANPQAEDALVREALDRVVAQEAPLFEGTIRGLSGAQKTLLKILASEPTLEPTAGSYAARAGLSPSTAHQSLARLKEEDLVQKEGDGLWRVVDPVFEKWLVAQAGFVLELEGE